MSTNLLCYISAVFNKGFSLHPPSLLLLACGAAQGPPDAQRQMSLVEQNMHCMTSHEATGLLRQLKGCLPSIDHSLKGYCFSRSSPPYQNFLEQKDTAEIISGHRQNACQLQKKCFLNKVVIEKLTEITDYSQFISGIMHQDECKKTCTFYLIIYLCNTIYLKVIEMQPKCRSFTDP